MANEAKARNENALFPLWRYSFSFMAFATEAKSVSFVLVAAFVSWTHHTLVENKLLTVASLCFVRKAAVGEAGTESC